MLWLNGALLAPADARIDPADRGLLLGDGLFETLKIAGGAPLRVDRHLARLRSSAAALRLPVPYDDETLAAAMAGLIGATAATAGTLRLTLTRGPAPRGLLPPAQPAPTVLMTVGAAAPLTPARLVTALVTRRNQYSPLSRIKSLNYLDNILARQEAADRGADDAVLLNGDGKIAETSIANLFAVIGGALVTPPVTDGALPGIRRALLLEAGGVAEQSLTPDDLSRADEIFLTNSGGIRPVISLDGAPVGSGTPGPVWASLAGEK